MFLVALAAILFLIRKINLKEYSVILTTSFYDINQ